MKLFILLIWVALASSSKIYMILSLGSMSHKNIFVPLAEKLTDQGHDVSIVSMYKSSNPKFNDVVASTAGKQMRATVGEVKFFDKESNPNDVFKKIFKYMPALCDYFLSDPAVQEIFDSKPDLIMLPSPLNECGLIFVEKFKVPFIYVTTSGLTPWAADLVGNPEHPAFVPNQYSSYTDHMSLYERTMNTIARIFTPVLRNKIIVERLDSVAEKHLHIDYTSLAQVEKNVSMVFVNSHTSLGFPRPLQPNVIEVGGMQCKESAKSVEDFDSELGDFLDSATNGAIFFSLGSYLQSNQLPENYRNMLVSAFAKLPYKVIWKWEGEAPRNLTNNVILRNWLPQQEILQHPNTKAFFTHGGLLSTQESVYHSVPMVGLPVISDQHLNVKQSSNLGVAIGLDLHSLTEKDIIESLTKVIEDKSFSRNVQKRSRVMKDQETHPVDRAAFWTNYVIRHGGAHHLKSAALSLTTTQYYLIDVGLVLSLITLLICVIIFYFLRLVFSLGFRSFKFSVEFIKSKLKLQ